MKYVDGLSCSLDVGRSKPYETSLEYQTKEALHRRNGKEQRFNSESKSKPDGWKDERLLGKASIEGKQEIKKNVYDSNFETNSLSSLHQCAIRINVKLIASIYDTSTRIVSPGVVFPPGTLSSQTPSSHSLSKQIQRFQRSTCNTSTSIQLLGSWKT